MGAIWGVVAQTDSLSDRDLAAVRPAHRVGSITTRPFARAALFAERADAAAAGGHQPSTHGIVADARLDDREHLIARLGGNATPASSDAALILSAWRQWNTSLPAELYGDYAFALWDEGKGELLCARDHIGARPLYYATAPGRFYFASHLRVLLDIPAVSAELDEDFVAGLLHNHYAWAEPTYFKAIKKLPPAHALSVGHSGIRVWRHWDPSQARSVRFARDSEYVEAACDLLGRAVADRLRGVERAGVHLSGGLDSSSIAVLAAREQRRRGKPAPQAFSWQPAAGIGTIAAPKGWEHAFIQAVAEQEDLPTHYCEATAQDVLDMLREDPAREPVTQAQFLEIATQRKAASLGVDTILAGWGGDEGLSYYGRGYYADLFFKGRWLRMYRDARERAGHPLRRIVTEVLTTLHPDAAAILLGLVDGKPYKYGWNNFVHPQFARRLPPPRLKRWREWSIQARMASAWASAVHAERMESWYCHGARHGIVYAYPLLDRRVLEFAAGLPAEQFVRGRWTRWLMRKSAERLLPNVLCWHTDKSEPVRFPATLRTIQHVLAKVGEGLTAARELPPRSQYVDVPRLLERLRPGEVHNDPRAGGLLRTVQFVGLDGIEVSV